MFAVNEHAIERFKERHNATDVKNIVKKINQYLKSSIQIRLKEYYAPRMKYRYGDAHFKETAYFFNPVERLIIVVNMKRARVNTLYNTENLNWYEYLNGVSVK